MNNHKYPDELIIALETDPYNEFFLSVEMFYKEKGFITEKQRDKLIEVVEMLNCDACEQDLY